MVNCCSVRDATRRDAVVYSTKVLPLANMVVTNISQYFDNYLTLEHSEWLESLEDIIDEVTGVYLNFTSCECQYKHCDIPEYIDRVPRCSSC
jgi:hypothetical protein